MTVQGFQSEALMDLRFGLLRAPVNLRPEDSPVKDFSAIKMEQWIPLSIKAPRKASSPSILMLLVVQNGKDSF